MSVAAVASLAVGLLAVVPAGAASTPVVPQEIHAKLYEIYNSSAAMVVRLHAWRLINRFDSSLPRPGFAGARPAAAVSTVLIQASVGGRAARADGAALDIPAGALSADTTVSISTPTAQEASARTAAATAAGLTAASDEVDFEPNGIALRRSVEVTLNYGPQWQSRAYSLHIYCWQTSRSRWQRLPTRIDASKQTASTRPLSLMPCRVFVAR